LHIGEDFLRGRNARVRADQQLFELVPDLVIDLRAVEETGDAGEPAFPRAFERLIGLVVGFLGALEDAKNAGDLL
jgi:hypothetical protein